MMPKFKTIQVQLPKHDADVVIVFPGGDKLLVQARPSNASEDHNGSLDIILPRDECITCWRGDDMEDAPMMVGGTGAHERLAKQLVTVLPGDYD